VLAENLWPALVDVGQLENAIVNLAINARDAMPDGGKLAIETANTEIGSEAVGGDDGLAPGSYVTVTVSDTGTGMPPDVMTHVFEPFFTTKKVGKGSGLGLSMVYGFAKQSGGLVRIFSEVGKGTSVRIYLPKAKVASATIKPRKRSKANLPAGRDETILVVEDSEDLRQVAVAQLQSLEYTVLQANDGHTALALLREHPNIDLLFTDVILPGGMNGGELARHAQALNPNLKVLFASGYSRNTLIHQDRLKKGVRLINKPYRRQDLAREIRAALDALADKRLSA
jgi:CheY-like chemotaxis protein